MELTRDFKTTILERAQAEPEFRVGLFTAAECLLNGKPDVAKTLLRDYVNATIGFQALAEIVDKNPTSLMQILSDKGNPSLDNILQVLAAVREHEGVHLHVSQHSQMIFNPRPPIPQELVDAAASGMLVVFVGAGISRLIGCPSWDGFADAVLDQLLPPHGNLDYHEKSLIDSIPDPRKRLSIAKILDDKNGGVIEYERIFNRSPLTNNVYSHINSFQCSFVTTNYDKHIKPEFRKSEPEENWRFFQRQDMLAAKLDDRGSVIHLHGCVDDFNSMVITTKDYLTHYASKEISVLLEHLFSKKTVLFLGYGLDETEILEYIFKFGNPKKKEEKRLFILQGFFNAEKTLFNRLKSYYQDSLNAQLIGFPKDRKNFNQQTEIIEKWGESLSFRDPTLVVQRDILEDEISG